MAQQTNAKKNEALPQITQTKNEEAIKVIARFRPFNELEINTENVVKFTDTEQFFINHEQQSRKFVFDHIFKPDDGQQVVFA